MMFRRVHVWSTHSSNIYASGTYAWSIGRHAHPFGAEQVNWQWHGSHSVGRTHSFGRVILSTVSLWLAHLSVRDIGRHIHYTLPMVGRHIQVRGTCCPLLVGTFICAGHVVHYWSAHSGARDMLSIIGRHIQMGGTGCPLLVGTFRCAGQVVHYWSVHPDVRDMLSIIGRHIQMCGTCCPLLVGTFICAGHVIHYWSAHSLCAGHVVHYWSVVRDMYWSGAGQVARFGLALIGGLHSVAWEAITITSAIVLAYGKP